MSLFERHLLQASPQTAKDLAFTKGETVDRRKFAHLPGGGLETLLIGGEEEEREDLNSTPT